MGKKLKAGGLRAMVATLVLTLLFTGGIVPAFADPGDSIPEADLLNVDFSTRAAADLSSRAHDITGGNGNIAYDDTLNKYVAKFSGNVAEAFKIPWSAADYTKSNAAITLEAVFKAEPYTATYQDFFGNMQSAGIGFEISRCTSASQTKGSMEVYVRKYNNGVSGANAYISPALAPNAANSFNFGEWVHSAITYDGSTVKLYINGVEKGSWAMSGPIVTPAAASQKFVIGGDVNNSGDVESPLQQGGAMSVARVYSQALTAEEIAALSSRELAPRAKVNADSVEVSATNGANSITVKGGSLTLKADVQPIAANNNVVWSLTSGDDYATISDAGRLTAKANGTVTVRATAADGSGAYGEMTVDISGQDAASPTGDTVRFGVISDTHVTATKTVQQQRLAKAMKFFSGNDANTPIEPVEKLVVVGDLTDNGVSSEMNTWKGIKETNLEVPLQAGMGNHENNRWAEFEDATGNKANYVTKLNGYTFITVSPGSGSIDPVTGRATGTGTGSYAYAVSWLEQQLEAAEAESPDKPIFVFFHHPIRGTFYVSNEWNGSGFENVFKTHPRAVTFAGHIHSPNNISTSIWQDGGYTAVNTVSTSYFELERGMIYGSVPPNASQCAQGLLVEASDSAVTIKNYDILADAWIDQTWSFDVDPENRNMPYTQANLGSKAVAPVFADDAEITVSNQRERIQGIIATFTFDQAEIPATSEATMGDIVHTYRYDFVNKATNTIEKTFKSWSDWYITPMPQKYTMDMGVENEQAVYLTPGADYELRITAIDTFGNESAQPLTKEFTAIGTYTERPPTPMNFALTFENNLNNKNFSPQLAYMVKNEDENVDGQASYVDGKNGKAIQLDNDNFVQLENNANAAIDYNQSFTLAYWVNFKDFAGDDPAVVSNKDWNSGNNDGFLYNIKQGRLRLNWTPPSGSRHDDWADPNASTAKNQWMHIAATFDKASDTVTMYYNGNQISKTTNAGLARGLGSNGYPTLVGNSYNSGGHYYNKTGGGYQAEMLIDDFVLVNEVYSADKIKSLTEDNADIKRSLLVVNGAFPETVYKDEAIPDFPSLSTVVPDAKLWVSLSIKGGSELFHTPELLDEMDINTVLTKEIFDSLPAGEYDVKINVCNKLSELLVLETKTVSIKVENTRKAPPASAAIAGPASITERSNGDYMVSLANIKNAGTVKLDIAYSENLEMVGAEALGGKLSVLDAKDNHNGTATVTLWAPPDGASIGSDAENVLKITAKATAEGTANVSLTGITAVVYVKSEGSDEFDDVRAADAVVEDGKGSASTTVKKYYEPYDFNRDGQVNILDLTYAQLFYQVSDGDAKWATVADRGIDVNGDGTVDVGDFVNIMNYIYSL